MISDLFGRKDVHPVAVDADVIYAIGDIHGCFDQLKRLEALILGDAAQFSGSKIIVTLGDYVDRGPGSAQVLDWLLAPPPPGFARVALKGNHEELMLAAFDNPATLERWLSLGGVQTLQSYGIAIEHFVGMSKSAQKAVLEGLIPPDHISLLRQLPILAISEDYVFAHAGIRPGVPLLRQREEDLIWIREPFLSTPHGLSQVVVHGHTPKRAVVVEPFRIGLDTAAFAGGPLSAVRLSRNGERHFLAAQASE